MTTNLPVTKKTCRSLNWKILFSFELKAVYLELFEKFLKKKKIGKASLLKHANVCTSLLWNKVLQFHCATKCYGFKWQLDNYMKEKSMKPIYWLCYRTEQPWASRNRVTEENLFIRNILLATARSTSELTSAIFIFQTWTRECLIALSLSSWCSGWRNEDQWFWKKITCFWRRFSPRWLAGCKIGNPGLFLICKFIIEALMSVIFSL